MKAAITSFVHNKVQIILTEVDEPGEICVVQRSIGDNHLQKISSQISISNSRSLILPWDISFLFQPGKKLKLLYTTQHRQELVDFDVSGLFSSLRPLQADLVKELPGSIQRIAACTICYNEDFIIKKWAQHYGGLLGYENLYVIDDGSDTPVAELLSGLPVNITRIPRTSFDSWRLVRTLGYMQRVLLETYDLVITSDSDEFVVCVHDDPDMDLAAYLRTLNPADMVNVAPVGFDLVHSRSREQDIDPERPVVEQRKYVMRCTGFDKPIISSVPTSFMPGLHNAYFPKRVDNNLLLLHVRAFDYNFAVNKLNRYKNTEWSEYDLKTGLAFHQRQKIDELDAGFENFDKMIDGIDIQKKMSDLENKEFGLLDDSIRRHFTI